MRRCFGLWEIGPASNQEGAAGCHVQGMHIHSVCCASSVVTHTQELFREWSKETAIAIQDLMVWNYTERRNKTMRPNRLIRLDGCTPAYHGAASFLNVDDQQTETCLPFVGQEQGEDSTGELEGYGFSQIRFDRIEVL